MANADRKTRDAVELEEVLAKEPHKFGFFNALRALECAYREWPRMGMSRRPREDPVRLGQRPHMEFAPTTLAAFSLMDSWSELDHRYILYRSSLLLNRCNLAKCNTIP